MWGAEQYCCVLLAPHSSPPHHSSPSRYPRCVAYPYGTVRRVPTRLATLPKQCYLTCCYARVANACDHYLGAPIDARLTLYGHLSPLLRRAKVNRPRDSTTIAAGPVMVLRIWIMISWRLIPDARLCHALYRICILPVTPTDAQTCAAPPRLPQRSPLAFAACQPYSPTLLRSSTSRF